MRYHQLKENSALEKTEEIIKKTFSPERKEVQSEVLALARMAEMGRGDKTELLMKLTALTKKEMDAKKADPDLKHSVDSNVKIMAVAVEKLMGTTMDESWDEVKETELPPHLAKFFDKDGNLNPDAQARLDKGRAKRKKSKDVTPAGYGPADDIEEDIKMNSRGKLERDTPYGELPSELEDDDDDDLEARFNKAMKEDEPDYEKVMARQMTKRLQDIRYMVADMEDKISQVAQKDNGDLTDQITTMDKLTTQLYLVLSRAISIVPTYEGKSPHKKGTAKYKKHMAAMHAEGTQSIEERDQKQDAFSAKEIKMAIGIASDPRYAKGNMTGAVNAIEKISKGLSNHKQVAAVLKRQNEAIDLDAMLASHLAEADEKSYTVVHVKHGKEVIKATSSYGAAKKYADMKKLKSTAGVDAHLMEGRNDGPMSSCCDAPLSNYENGLGICSDCGEHADAHNEDELNEAQDTLMGVKDPVIVITDANGKPVDKLQMSIAAKKYKFNMAAIRPQFKHQDKVKHGNFTLSAPINGQPMEGYARLPDMPDKYVARDGLEGPIMTRSGKVVYYDKDEGKYYDPDTDMYLTYDEWKAFDPDLPIKESKATAITEAQFDEAAGEKDACYHKVKSRYKVWPSAYASGALTKCRKVGAANWGNSKKK